MVNLPIYYPNGIDAAGVPLHPLKASLTQDIETGGSGSLVLGPDDPDIVVGNFVRMYTVQGDAGVYVIAEERRDITGGSRTLTLQHAWSVLDRSIVWHGDDEQERTMDIAEALGEILQRQNSRHWVLGTCDFHVRVDMGTGDKTIRAAFADACSRLTSYRLDFDTSQHPFVVSVRQKPTNAVAELRLSRNVSGLTWTLSTSGMYTRIWPRGFEELSISEGSLDRNTDVYGIIESVQTNPGIESEADLRAWALAELEKHAQPIVQVTVEGIAMSRITGEPLDRFVIGTACRVPLPQYGTAITDNIVSLNWPDIYGSPERVTISLANNRQNVASVTKASQARAEALTAAAGRSGGGSAKKDFIDELFGDPETGVWSRIEANQNLIRATVMGITNASQIEMKPDAIRQSIYAVREADNTRYTEEIGRVRLYAEGVNKSVFEVKADVANIDTRLTNINSVLTNVGGVLSATNGLVCGGGGISAGGTVVSSGGITIGGWDGSSFTPTTITYMPDNATTAKRTSVLAS